MRLRWRKLQQWKVWSLQLPGHCLAIWAAWTAATFQRLIDLLMGIVVYGATWDIWRRIWSASILQDWQSIQQNVLLPELKHHWRWVDAPDPWFYVLTLILTLMKWFGLSRTHKNGIRKNKQQKAKANLKTQKFGFCSLYIERSVQARFCLCTGGF